MRYAERLQWDRKGADYGPTEAFEPYTEKQADERMTMLSGRLDVAEEIEAAHALCRDAEAAYIAALSDIVDVRTLTGGRDGYDFYARVPATELHETTQRIVDLEFDIREKYSIHFRTYAIPTGA